MRPSPEGWGNADADLGSPQPTQLPEHPYHSNHLQGVTWLEEPQVKPKAAGQPVHNLICQPETNNGQSEGEMDTQAFPDRLSVTQQVHRPVGQLC